MDILSSAIFSGREFCQHISHFCCIFPLMGCHWNLATGLLIHQHGSVNCQSLESVSVWYVGWIKGASCKCVCCRCCRYDWYPPRYVISSKISKKMYIFSSLQCISDISHLCHFLHKLVTTHHGRYPPRHMCQFVRMKEDPGHSKQL